MRHLRSYTSHPISIIFYAFLRRRSFSAYSFFGRYWSSFLFATGIFRSYFRTFHSVGRAPNSRSLQLESWYIRRGVLFSAIRAIRIRLLFGHTLGGVFQFTAVFLWWCFCGIPWFFHFQRLVSSSYLPAIDWRLRQYYRMVRSERNEQ